eukprot:TRINITY_DN6641_c0_g1_i2.p1 TRINITY_DN6641_c0_g1~~TRINITY_DN6641_c0_g1_i2.p1  ORF type:complete len:321 (+),score=58.71 TRINITY_DN6641_c0_g1_i2:38-964(+)
MDDHSKELTSQIKILTNTLTEMLSLIHQKEIELNSILKRIHRIQSDEKGEGITMGYIEINVGGVIIETSKSTLCAFEESMLSAMFSGRHVLPCDKEGRPFIDADGVMFRDEILPILRAQSRGYFSFEFNKYRKELIEELVYFGIACDVSQERYPFIHPDLWDRIGSGWTIVYQSSEDDYSHGVARSKCNDTLPLLLIHYASNGVYYGGYTESSGWKDGNWKPDMKAFVFEYSSPEEECYFREKKTTNDSAFSWYKTEQGPCFAHGHGICTHLTTQTMTMRETADYTKSWKFPVYEISLNDTYILQKTH